MIRSSILGWCLGIAAALSMATAAHADPIPPDLDIFGEIEYDTSDGENDTGSFSIIGGVASSYANGIISDPNPLIDTRFSDIGDGFEIGGSVFGDADGDAGGTTIDFFFDIDNNTADDFKIGFKVTLDNGFGNSAAANGPGGFAESLLDFFHDGTILPDDSFVEWDSDADGDGSDADTTDFTFFVTVLAGAPVTTIGGSWGAEIEIFDIDSDATAALNATITIDSIVNLTGPAPVIPEPGTWVLMSLGALGFALYRRRTKN